MRLLEFVFQNAGHFFGALILLAILLNGLAVLLFTLLHGRMRCPCREHAQQGTGGNTLSES